MSAPFIIPVERVCAGTRLVCDGGFTCLSDGQEVIVEAEGAELFVACACGRHGLDGQLDDAGENYVGFQLAASL